MIPDLKRWAMQSLDDLAVRCNLDRDYSVFILGPYSPPKCKTLLVAIRDALRARKYLAFLESDFQLVASLQDSSRAFFDASRFNVFIATKGGISRGWQFEVADLARQSGQPLSKLAFYYESYDSLQGPVKDFIGNHRMLHEQIIRPNDLTRTTTAVCQHVNSYFMHLRAPRRKRHH